MNYHQILKLNQLKSSNPTELNNIKPSNKSFNQSLKSTHNNQKLEKLISEQANFNPIGWKKYHNQEDNHEDQYFKHDKNDIYHGSKKQQQYPTQPQNAFNPNQSQGRAQGGIINSIQIPPSVSYYNDSINISSGNPTQYSI